MSTVLDKPQAAATPDGKTFDRKNPITGALATRAKAFTAAEASAVADVAAAAFPAWSALGPNARRAFLNKAADIMQARSGELTEIMAKETGCTPAWAGFNAYLAPGMLREAAAITTQISGEIIPADKPGCMAMGVRRAAGVCLGIAPWNAPIILGTRAIALALACGNTVILKASELSPGTHLLIGKIFEEAGFPSGVVNVVTNAPEDAHDIVKALIAHDAVRRVNFTGSTHVGRIIGALAGHYLKPALLELGGKAPLVILDDADLDAAVDAAAFGAFMHQGQICMSTERIVVQNTVGDAFIAKFVAKAAKLTAGDPSTGKNILGSLVGPEPIERIKALIKDALDKGAKMVVGGRSEGTFMDATVLDHVTPAMRIYHEETFGPVVCVVRAGDDNDAVRIANDTEYGLSAAVFTKHIDRALSVANRIDSGICHINGPTVHDEAQMPFGGVKGSGYGRFGGQAGINEFTDLRWITIENEQHYPF
jgi:acyl-CoA reductase-like NAD-dependent aldehyde dehydrogenase